MTRRHVQFACAGEKLVGTVDEGTAKTGLLIVSGGNEVRSGAFGGQATLAARIAGYGFPVFRFDRRGVGDSSGKNGEFRESREDILSAMAEFRKQVPSLERLVAFGNCDAASALVLMEGEGCDALILSNPWTFEDDGAEDTMPAEAIRERYAEKLRNPREVGRLLTGKVNLLKLLKGLKAASKDEKPAEPSSLAAQIVDRLTDLEIPASILIASRDRTGRAFEAIWPEEAGPIMRCEGASHAYVEPHARKWLEDRILEVLRA